MAKYPKLLSIELYIINHHQLYHYSMYIIHYSILCHSPSIRKGRNIRSSYPQVQSLGDFPCFSPEVLGWMWFSMILNGAVLSLVIAPREDRLSLVSRWVAGGDGNEN